MGVFFERERISIETDYLNFRSLCIKAARTFKIGTHYYVYKKVIIFIFSEQILIAPYIKNTLTPSCKNFLPAKQYYLKMS